MWKKIKLKDSKLGRINKLLRHTITQEKHGMCWILRRKAEIWVRYARQDLEQSIWQGFEPRVLAWISEGSVYYLKSLSRYYLDVYAYFCGGHRSSFNHIFRQVKTKYNSLVIFWGFQHGNLYRFGSGNWNGYMG